MDFNSEKLIGLVKKRRSLYDFTITYHRDKTVSEKLWNEIADEMESDVHLCKAKWGRLRSSYSNYLKYKCGLNPDKLKKPRKEWHLGKKMDFLRKFIKPKGLEKECYLNLPNFNGPEFDIGTIITIDTDESSCITLSTLKTKSENCDTYDDDDDHISIVSTIGEGETEKQLFQKFDLKHCRIEISCKDQNFLLLRQLEAERRLKDNENSVIIKQEKIEYDDSKILTAVSTVNANQVDAAYLSSVICKEEVSTLEHSSTLNSYPVETTRTNSKAIVLNQKENHQSKLVSETTKRKGTPLLDSSSPSIENLKTMNEDTTLAFFNGILPDINILSERGLRLFKQEILLILNNTLDDQENDSSQMDSG